MKQPCISWKCKAHPTFPKMILSTSLLLFSMTGNVHAEAQSKITVHSTVTSFKEIIREIEKQTDYDFIYNSKMLPTETFTLNAKGRDVFSVLDELCNRFNVEYSIKNNIITLKAASAQKPQTPQHPVSALVELKGYVTDEKGEPLPGVSIKIKGTAKGTSTNLDGKFKLMVSEGEKITLACSMIGMEPQEVHVKKIKELDIVMKESSQLLNEVVKIGYATVPRSDLTGSISSLDTRIIESSAATSITDMMQGQIPGLSISLGDGAPGSKTSGTPTT